MCRCLPGGRKNREFWKTPQLYLLKKKYCRPNDEENISYYLLLLLQWLQSICFIFSLLDNKNKLFLLFSFLFFCYYLGFCCTASWQTGCKKTTKKIISSTFNLYSLSFCRNKNKSCRFFLIKLDHSQCLLPLPPPPLPPPRLQCVSGRAVWVPAVSPGRHDAGCQEALPAAVLLPGNTSTAPRSLFCPAAKLHLITFNGFAICTPANQRNLPRSSSLPCISHHLKTRQTCNAYLKTAFWSFAGVCVSGFK